MNRIFTPESITLNKNYDAKIMSQKALPSVLLHKSEVTYKDTGVSKIRIKILECYYKKGKIFKSCSPSIHLILLAKCF